MPAFSTEVPNPLGQEAATEKLKNFMETVRSKYGDQISNLEEAWEGSVLNFSFTTYGFGISGVMNVQDDKVALDGKLPFAAMAFKGRIEETIRTELSKQLNA